MAERKLDIIVQAKDRVAAGLKSIQQRLTNFAKRVAQVGVVATAAASAAIIEMGRRGAAAVDELAKLARQTGENINTLNALRGAADRAGVGASTITSSLQAMQKRLGEAARGTGMARDSLEELGIEVETILSLPLSEQLALIADRMATIDDENRKAAIAAGLFSRAGQSMVLMLQDGSDAFRENIDRVSRFRAELDQVGAEGVERANDAITDLRDSIASIGQLIAIRMAPQIEQFAGSLAERMASVADRLSIIFTEPFRGIMALINRMFDTAADRGGGMADTILNAMEIVSRRIGEFFATLPETIRIVALEIEDQLLALTQRILAAFQSLPRGVQMQLGLTPEGISDAREGVGERQNRIRRDLPMARQDFHERREEFRNQFLSRIMDDISEQASRIFDLPGEAAKRSIEQQEELIRATERRAESLEALAREQERLGKAEAEQTRRNAELNRATLEEERQTLEGMRQHAEGLRGIAGQIPRLAERAREMFRFGGQDADSATEAQRRVAEARAPSLETGRLITGASAARSDVDQKQLEEQRKQSTLLTRAVDGIDDMGDVLRDIMAGGGFNGRIGGLIGS